MQSVGLGNYLAGVNRRKAELGLNDTPERTEALRNKGTNRTKQKREFLRRTEARARLAGLPPVTSYF